jgi:ribonuclease VapC
MVLDTSAILAVLQNEAERRTFLEAIEAADSVRMSVASFVEASIVIESRHGTEGLRDLDRFLARARVEVVPVDVEQGNLARGAYYGDCFFVCSRRLPWRTTVMQGR